MGIADAAVIDVFAEPALAEEAHILATPTLVYENPTRSKRIIGDLGDFDRVLNFLGLKPHGDRT